MAYRDFDLWTPPPDPRLQRFEHITTYAETERMPWRRSTGCPEEELRSQEAHANDERGFPLRPAAYIPRRAFTQVLQERFANDLADAAANALARNAPEASAFRLLTIRQKAVLAVLVVALASSFALAPLATLVAINAVLTAYFLSAIFFRLYLTWVGFGAKPGPAAPPLREKDLPVITILLPAHNEASGLALLAQAMDAIDYPRDKLDIKLLLEGDDNETIAEARRLKLERTFDLVLIPPSEPRTKPKACNHGLYLARGDLIVIYDAEDAPEPDQLLKAAAAFAASDERLACVQAKLNFYDADESWLTRLFAIEYALWFDTLLTALEKLDIPIPLGGTSNFFRTRILREIGGWDPYNVTEDADLGLRLARHGYRTEILDSTTFEEANSELHNWVRQRSRWMKGYMQTWLVHMRKPSEFLRVAGWRALLATQLFVAGNFFSALVNPFLWFVFVFWLATRSEDVAAFFPGPLLALNLFALLFGNCFFVYVGVIAPLKRGWVELAPAALLAPIYWWITSIAAYKALWQLLTRPSFWEKTQHVLSRGAKRRRGIAVGIAT
jgi:cellulose synthase/poly-beta-1,6-N-acetylglucosamine synthase-like glycosyltransferase